MVRDVIWFEESLLIDLDRGRNRNVCTAELEGGGGGGGRRGRREEDVVEAFVRALCRVFSPVEREHGRVEWADGDERNAV